jgi:acylglycerol lipase
MAKAQSLVRVRALARLAAQSIASFVLVLTAACAPTVQRALAADAAYAGPHFDLEAERFRSFDGAELGLSAWLPQAPPPVQSAEGEPQAALHAAPEPWAVIVALHGMNDYGNAFHLSGPYFAARGVATYAYDARGFGRSPNRGLWAGERLMTEDLRTALRVAKARHPNALLVAMGDSMGSAEVVATFGGPNAPEADRIVLVAPAVWGWSSLPDVYAMTLWTGAHTFPWRPVSPPRGVTRRIVASDNTPMLRALGRDQNMIFRTRIDAVYGLVGLMETAQQRIGNLKEPVGFFYGAHDQIIPRASAEIAASRLPHGARTAYYADGYHMLLRDLQAQVVYDDILAFIRDPEAPFPSGAPPVNTPRRSGAQTQANR